MNIVLKVNQFHKLYLFVSIKFISYLKAKGFKLIAGG